MVIEDYAVALLVFVFDKVTERRATAEIHVVFVVNKSKFMEQVVRKRLDLFVSILKRHDDIETIWVYPTKLNVADTVPLLHLGQRIVFLLPVHLLVSCHF